MIHKSVLLEESVDLLDIKPGGIYIDATFGGGGHTKAILQKCSEINVIAIDWDKKAIETNGEILKEKFGNRLKLVWANFAKLYLVLKKEKIDKVDGILADFGTSRNQILEGIGFSFKTNTFLDMRMSPAHQRITAADVLKSTSERDLQNIFFKYGEEKKSKFVARKIIETRKINPIETTRQLAELVESVIRRKPGQRIHPATKIFQALRIFVNKELENIDSFLKSAIHHLKIGGKIVCISFHSLEDRIVKNIFAQNSEILEIDKKKLILPSGEEIERNKSSRSAKMRAARKIF